MEKPSLLLERDVKTCNVTFSFRPSPVTLKVLVTDCPSTTVPKSNDVGVTLRMGVNFSIGIRLSVSCMVCHVELGLTLVPGDLEESIGEAQHRTAAITRAIAKSTLCFIAFKVWVTNNGL